MNAITHHDPDDRAKILKLGIAALVAVMILAMWGMGVVSIYLSRQAALAKMETDATNLAVAFDDGLTHTLDTVAGNMDAVANRMRAGGSDMNIYAWSREIPIASGPVIEGGIILPNGMLVSDTKVPDLKPINLSAREYFRIQLDGKYKGLFVGTPVKSRDYDRMVIPISKRIETKGGRFVGVLVFMLSPAKLTILHQSINLGDYGTIALVGSDGIIRARFKKNKPEGLDGIGVSIAHKSGPRFNSELSQGSYIKRTATDHIKRVYSYRRIANYPLFVNVGLGYDEGLELWWRNTKSILVLSAAATLLILGFALYLMREIGLRAKRDRELADERNKLRAANLELTDERRKLQTVNAKLIESKERAEVANRTKSLFLANMSHELRTPLNAIIGFSQIIKDQIMGPLGKPVYADYAKDIQGAGEHLLAIINNVLDISKIEAGKTELRDETLNPADIVGASVAAVRVQAAGKKIALTVDIPPGIPFIRGDALRLREVLINLLSNAVKFTEAGRVGVTVAFDAAQGFCFTVADTGIGMTPGEIARALEPFGQVDNAFTKKYAGTGLGLPLAQRLVELHGGRLDITSVKGAGTAAAVHLPLERAIRPAASAAA